MSIGDANDRESRLDELLVEYIEAREAGKIVHRDEFLAQHPEFAQELAEFIDAHSEIEQVAGPLRAATLPDLGDHDSRFWARRNNLGPADQEHSAGSTSQRQLGEFRLIREIGRGGMGVVYEAEQVTLCRKVALKVLPFASAIDPRRLQRFKNEALAAANLRHENIVAVYGVGCDLGVHYYAMQLIEGQSLSELIAELKEQKQISAAKVQGQSKPVESPKSNTVLIAGDNTVDRSCFVTSLQRDQVIGSRKYFDWVATIGRKSALALHYAHEVGIVHRDIKPANLLIDPRGEIWITDFGLAQIAGDTGLTVSGEIVGTLRYASPELVRALPGIVDHRTDIFSLAATLYELVTLSPIFDGRDRNELLRQIGQADPIPPRNLNPSVPEELETILLKALSKSPSDRYSTAEDFAEDLKRFLDDKPIFARRPTQVELARKWLRRHPSVLIAGVVLLALTTIGSLIASAMIHREQLKVEQAYQRERARADEVEAQYQLARRSVDELLRASEEELAGHPGTEPLRKRLLTSVLSYYREFLDRRKEDKSGHADLLEARTHVEKILADLAALRTSRQLHLLEYDSVLDDLKLDEQQRLEVKQLSQKANQQFKKVIGQLGRRPPAERSRQLFEYARQNEISLQTILSRQQVQRLYQISLQTDVSDAFRDPEVASTLQLSDGQQERAGLIEEEILVSRFRTATGHGPSKQVAEKRSVPSANKRALAILSDPQIAKWREITGPEFKIEIPRPPFILSDE